MNTAANPPILRGLHELASDYDALICDVWGVVHNGREPNPATVDALQGFRASRGPVILLTNAPRIAADVRSQFDRIGVPHDCYDAIVTSGQAARDDLVLRASAAKPLALFNLGPERDRATYDGVPLSLVPADEADLVLCTGLFDDETETPDDYRGMLEGFRSRDLLMICANPDVTVRRGDTAVYCAGAIARAYETVGGKVLYYGKPHPPIFEAAIAQARRFGAARRPLVVGDGLETDIRGANRMGWDALFVSGGLFGVEIGSLTGDRAAERLGELFVEHDVHARAVMTTLAW